MTRLRGVLGGFVNSNSYGAVTYGKSGRLLATIEGMIGSDVMAEAMRTYFQRYKFQHPDTEQFLQTIEEVAIAQWAYCRCGFHGAGLFGGDGTPSLLVNSGLRPFIKQAVYGTAEMDYAVDAINFTPVQWWLPDDDAKQDKRLRNTVTIHRVGDFKMPAELEIKWSDGTVTEERWGAW